MTEKKSRYSGVDKKAAALTGFTIRQMRTKLSTWAVMGVGMLAILMVLLFHVDAQTRTIEDIDNDLDSYDFDGDGYPNGQETRWLTDIRDPDDHPGLINSSITPDDPSLYINEDGFDWDSSSSILQSVGKDDDGDCEHPEAGEMVTDSQKDSNGNGIPCDIQVRWSEIEGKWQSKSDIGVDEDPDEDEYFHEAMHRAFIIGFGKVGFVLLIGIFLPLFLATGLIRQEIENETLHYLVSKPIHRAEVLIYRLLGFLAIAIPYIAILVILSALVVGFTAPGDSFFRIQDLGIWLGIMLASWLMVIVYGAIFMVFGMVHRFGMIAAIILGVWEFVLAMITLADPSLFIARLSVVFWGMTIVDACASMIYPDTPFLITQGKSVSGGDDFSALTGYITSPQNLPGTEALNSFWNSPSLGFSPFITLLISVFVLLAMVISMLFIGQAIFKGKEIS